MVINILENCIGCTVLFITCLITLKISLRLNARLNVPKEDLLNYLVSLGPKHSRLCVIISLSFFTREFMFKFMLEACLEMYESSKAKLLARHGDGEDLKYIEKLVKLASFSKTSRKKRRLSSGKL